MDLSTIYSKTPKGLRARASLIGGLSSHLMKVLTHIDGSSKAENILLKFDKLTPQQLSADLIQLEQEGYIRLATVTSASDDSWALTINFEPMVVEEYQSEEELEATALKEKAEQTRKLEQQQAEQQAIQALQTQQAQAEKAKQEEEQRLIAQEAAQQAAQLKAEKKAQKLRAKQKAKAETKVKAIFAQELLAEDAAKSAEAARVKAEAEALEKMQQQAAILAQQQAAERAAKLAEAARVKAELKAREAAEQADADAEAKAKERARSEIERISREAEEAQKKADAEIKAKQEAQRLEALRVAKVEEEARQAEIKQQAERQLQLEQKAKQIEQARVEADAQAREKLMNDKLEKEKLALEMKEKARLEIASVLRKAEEDRKNTVAKAKAAKLEVKRQAKAAQEAQLQAERKAKEEVKQKKLKALAEEKAQAEAVEIARQNTLEEERKQTDGAKLAADLMAKAELEQQKTAQQNEELKAQQAAEALRASLVAEELAKSAAKEQARLEMERIGREAELARQNTAVVQPAAEVKKDLPILDDFDMAEATEEAMFEAEEKADAEMRLPAQVEKPSSEKAARKVEEDAGRADIRHAAMAEAEAMASLHGKMQSFLSIKRVKKWFKSLSKITFIYVPVLALVMVAILSFVNLSTLIQPIEHLASESMGAPVTIKKVHASLWPQPHLVLEDVAIGANSNVKAIHVLPMVASLFEEVKVAKSLVLEGLTIEQANFGQSLNWLSNLSTAKNLKVEQINLKNLSLAIRDLQLESFDGKVTLTEAGVLSKIDLVSSNNALTVMISPQGTDYSLLIKAANWALPFNNKIIFSALKAKGLASMDQIEFSQIEGEIYGGSINGEANVRWPDGVNQWESTGGFELANANTELLLNSFGSAVEVDGKLALNGNFSSTTPEATKLAGAAVISANFNVRQGGIKGIELARAVIGRGSQSLAGNTTNFDTLTGSVKLNKSQYQFAKLVLASPQFNANGFININAGKTVSGRVNAGLVTQSRRLQGNFAIVGRGKDLKSN